MPAFSSCGCFGAITDDYAARARRYAMFELDAV